MRSLFIAGFLFGFPFLPYAATPQRGVAGDLWADVVLGQLDFTQNTFGKTSANRVNSPHGVVVDTSDPFHNRLYVYDDGNNRILGFSDISGFTPNHSAASTGYSADILIGQDDFEHTGANRDSTLTNYPDKPAPSATNLATQPLEQFSPGESGSYAGMAVDSFGNLYVPDFYNNRVLRYNKSDLVPGAFPVTAAGVWGQTDGLGQPDFTSRAQNRGGTPNDHTLYFNVSMYDSNVLAGVAVDSHNNLWVTDKINRRVLRFPSTDPLSATALQSQYADVVLGQADFNVSSPVVPSSAADLTHLRTPIGVRVDKQDRVFVVDVELARILVYVPTGGIGTALPQYGTGNKGLSASAAITQYLVRPTGIEFDAPATFGTGGLWVADPGNNQLRLYQESFLTPLTFSVTKVLLNDLPSGTVRGCGGLIGDAGVSFADSTGYVTPNSWCYPEAFGPPGVDSRGNVFISTNPDVKDVVRLPAPIPTPRAGVAHTADILVFKGRQIDGGSLPNNVTADSLMSPIGMAVWKAGGKTQVAVTSRDRIVYWDIPSGGVASMTSHDPPTGYVGTTDPTVAVYGNYYFRMAADRAADHGGSSSHLWVLKQSNLTTGGKIEVWRFDLPLSGSGSMGVKVLSSTLSLVGNSGDLSWTNDVNGIAVDPAGQYLWLAQQYKHRVFRVRDLEGTPKVDIILGQANATDATCNGSGAQSGEGCTDTIPDAAHFSHPSGLGLDFEGNLHVSDHGLESAGNSRMLKFSAADIQNPSTTNVLYGGNVAAPITASAVFGTGGSYTTTGGVSSMGVFKPYAPAFDVPSAGITYMVVGLNGQTSYRFPVVVDLSNPAALDNPVAHLADFSAQTYNAAFDDDHNLYVADMNWNRVLIYRQPFATGIATPTITPTPILTFTPTRTPTLTPTPTGSMSPTPTTTRTPTPTATTCGSCMSLDWGGDVSSGGTGVALFGNEVFVTNLNGKALLRYTVGVSAPVSVPVAMSTGFGGAVSPDGTYWYVADYSANCVRRMRLSDQSVTALATGAVVLPQDVAVQVSGGATYVYVVESRKVSKYREEGAAGWTLMTTFGDCSGGPTINMGAALDVVEGVVYVADRSNNRVTRWWPSTSPGACNGYEGEVAVTLTGPNALKVKGLYAYLQSTDGTFQVYRIDRSPWCRVFACGTAPGAGVRGIEVDEAGYVYCVNENNGKVERYAPLEARCLLDSACPPAWTVTPTVTPTATLTPSPSVTSTDTPTPVFSWTPTVTPSWTPTHSATPTTTATDTSTVTATFTVTPSGTPPATLTPTPSVTSTDTPTPVFSWTPTATASWTSTLNPSWTPSATPTASPTLSMTTTATESYTPTGTPTPTLTSSWTPSATPTASPTFSMTATATESYTPTTSETPTGTPSPTGTMTPTWTPSWTSSATPTASPTLSMTATATSTSGIPVVKGVPGHRLFPNPMTEGEATHLYGNRDHPSRGVRVKIFTVANRKVREMDLGAVPAGWLDARLDAKDERGRPLANGLYYVQVVDAEGPREWLPWLILR